VNRIKGVVLAGGLGKRLHPLTKITNKHLLPVYDRPMIYYPLQTLVDAGLEDIMIVTGGPYAGDFLRLLGDGKQFGLKELHYAYQEGEDGIAKALSLTRNFIGRDKVCVILGDNILEDDIAQEVDEFNHSDRGAHLFLKEVESPQRFGVACFGANGELDGIEEKPVKPKSRFAVTGVYMYDHKVFDIIDTLRPSARGEYEITDVSNRYIRAGQADFSCLKGWWTDAGTFESLHRAGELVHAARLKQKGARTL
jgi:glucose-1-phosphate thymidylyltransferase